MDEYREGLSGPLADAYERERWRVRRQHMHERIQELRERDRPDSWFKTANQQLQARLDRNQRVLMRPVLPAQPRRWIAPAIPEVVEPPQFKLRRQQKGWTG